MEPVLALLGALAGVAIGVAIGSAAKHKSIQIVFTERQYFRNAIMLFFLSENLLSVSYVLNIY